MLRVPLILLPLVVFFLLMSSSLLFGSPDDYCTFSAHVFTDGCMGAGEPDKKSLFETAHQQASGQGRFYQEIYYPLAQIVIMSPLWLLSVFKIFVLCLFFLSFYSLVLKMMNQGIAFFSIFSFIGIYYLGGSYNTVTGFPGWFLLGEVFFLISIYLGIGIRPMSHFLFKFAAGTLFFLGISSYESVILQTPFIFFLIWVVQNQSKSKLVANIDLKYMTKIFSYSFFIYATAYISYKILFPGEYSGSNLGSKNPITIVNSAILLSTPQSFRILLSSPTHNINSVLFLVFALIFIASIVAYSFTSRINEKQKVSLRRHDSLKGSYLLVLLVLVVLPNFPLALTKRYQDWSYVDSQYLGSLYSSLLLSILLGFIMHTINSYRLISKSILFSLFCFVYAFNSCVNLQFYSSTNDRNWIYGAMKQALVQVGCSNKLPIFVDFSDLNAFTGNSPYRFWEAFSYLSNNCILIQETNTNNLDKVFRFQVSESTKSINVRKGGD
jgi:hypothetical protein